MPGVVKIIVDLNEAVKTIEELLMSRYTTIKIYRHGSKRHAQHGLKPELLLIIAHR
ncbi:MAG: hypothetical protein QXM54_03510 [Desulfurococcaceae archaeon]